MFSDDSLLSDFCQEYNFKNNYILHGQSYDGGSIGRNATFLVEYSMGSTCYLRCYIINMFNKDEIFDTIGFQSPFLDDVFRYKYEYLDTVRSGINLGAEPKDIYKIPFSMNMQQYELAFRIGYDNRLGLLEDFDRKGELLIPVHEQNIQECYNLSVILYRLAMFMTSHAEVPFKQITLYREGLKAGWFYCPQISDDAASWHDSFFRTLDVMNYIPRILNNIALDSGNIISKSIPLGHLGSNDSMYTPQRFVEQIMAFEYIFDKIDHKKAQSKGFTLKDELQYAFNSFPELIADLKTTTEIISDEIKEIRRSIAHGYVYYYDFKTNMKEQYYMILLDKLIKKMSLEYIGFTQEEIQNFSKLW